MTKTAKLSRNVRITQRDIDIITMVYSFSGCSVEQLARRFWKITGQNSGSRSAWYRRIALLLEGNYLNAIRLASLSGTGSGKQFLTLGPAGRALLAETLELHPSELKPQSRTQAPYVGAHFLATGDVHLSLLLATESSGGTVELTEWIAETELRAKRAAQEVNPELPIADAEFVLTLTDGSSQGFRLEIDLTGSTSPRRFKKKLADYLRLVELDDRPVLWVAPTASRADVIAAWCVEAGKEAKADATLFWITTQGMISEETILKTVWQEISGPLVALVPQDSGNSVLQVESLSAQVEVSGGRPWRF